MQHTPLRVSVGDEPPTVRSAMAPLNIGILNLPSDVDKHLRPVTALDILEPSSRNFHPNGLFSVETFGRAGSEQRSRRFSYIDLKIPILHPLVFLSVVKMKELYGEIMSGKAYAVWDDESKNFIRSTPVDGDTGYDFFIKRFNDIVFEDTGSAQRTFAIKMIDKYRDKILLTKLLVIPAGLRDFEFDEANRPTEDEINTFYRRVLGLANIIPEAVVKSAPETLDNTRYSLQIAVAELYKYIKSLLEGKKKLVLGKWASRKIFNSTRNVISSNINNTSRLHGPLTVSYTQTVVGMYQYSKAVLPLTTYNVKNGFALSVFPDANSPALLVDKKTLRKVYADVSPHDYDKWMTDDGIEKMLTDFSMLDVRHLPITVGDYYLGLLYNDGKRFMQLHDINDLPEGMDKRFVSPMTFAEFLYINIYKGSDKIPCTVTRYPITGLGSVYPSMVYLKSTVQADVLEELDEHGLPTGDIAYQFPRRGISFMNTVAPHQSHLARLGADFDGDTVSFTALLTEEAKQEIYNLLHSARFYVNTDGKMTYSVSDDIADITLDYMTGD